MDDPFKENAEDLNTRVFIQKDLNADDLFVSASHAENVLMSPPQQAAFISHETIPALTAAVNAIKADALREAAEAWENEGHDRQCTSPGLWLADRSADTRANGLESGHAE